MPKYLVFSACAILLVLTACRSGGGEKAEVSQEFVAAAEKAVAEALLTPADLAPGWSAQPQDEDTNTDMEFTGECASYNRDEFLGEVASKDSDELTGPDDQQLFTSAVAFASDDEAEEALQEFAKLEDACREQLEEGFVKTFRESLAEDGVDNGEVNVSVEDLDFQEFGGGQGAYRVDWSYAYRGIELSGSMDFVFWRQGQMMGGFVYMAFGDTNMAEEQQVAKLIDEKLTRAEATLPG